MPSSGLHMLVVLARRALKGGTAFASWVTQAALFSAAWLISPNPCRTRRFLATTVNIAHSLDDADGLTE
jgi:hypothetical protein